MINILEKDGAVIITIEEPSGREKELIRQAKSIKDSARDISGIFGKFKCNKGKTPTVSDTSAIDNHNSRPPELDSLDGFVEIIGAEDVPF